MKKSTLSFENWKKQITLCRQCKSQLKWTNSDWSLFEHKINNSIFFITFCPVCHHQIYFWKELSLNQYYFVSKLHVVLHEPEIPTNVGSIIRLACAFEFTLHLIEPFGFIYSEKWLKRSSTNHFHLAHIKLYSSWKDFKNKNKKGDFFFTSAKAKKNINKMDFTQFGNPIYLIFGKESIGLPSQLLNKQPNLFRIPQSSLTSSINLSHAVAICAFFVRFQYSNFQF